MPAFNFRKIKNPFYTTCHKYQSEQLVYQEFFILAKLKTYIFFYSNIFFLQICPPAVFFTVDTKLCANKVVISLLIGFHNYSLQQDWKLSDSPFIFALRVSLVKYVLLKTSSIPKFGWVVTITWPKKAISHQDLVFSPLFLDSSQNSG